MSVKSQDVQVQYAELRKPLELAPGLTLSNRALMASLTRSRGVPADYANPAAVDYYAQRASAGLILTEGTPVSPQGSEWPHVISLYSSEHAKAWKTVTDAVHKKGGHIFAQIWHLGRVCHPGMPFQKGPVAAPSPISARGGKFRLLEDSPYVAPTQEHPNPRELVEQFRQGAVYAKEAGFDGVELHGANGYLMHQFIDKNSNHRTDEWGGSVENRTRFYRECIDAVLSVWPSDRVGIKLNPCGGYNDVGMAEEDTVESFSPIIKYCVEKQLSYIQLVRYLPWFDPVIDGAQRSLTHLDVLEVFGPLIWKSKTKLFLNGDLTGQEAEALLSEGKIDAAVFGRSFINNPDLVTRLFEGKALNEDLGFPADGSRFYVFLKSPREGYTTYPNYEEAKGAFDSKPHQDASRKL